MRAIFLTSSMIAFLAILNATTPASTGNLPTPQVEVGHTVLVAAKWDIGGVTV